MELYTMPSCNFSALAENEKKREIKNITGTHSLTINMKKVGKISLEIGKDHRDYLLGSKFSD